MNLSPPVLIRASSARLVVAGVERQGLRLSLSHIADHEWRAYFMGNPMFAPEGFGVAPTPWLAVQRAACAAITRT